MGQERSAGSAGIQRSVVAPLSLAFGIDDLSQVRRAMARWAAQAGLPAERARDFVLAVNEITTNAVVHGAPPARLLLRASEHAVVAEVHDGGRWEVPGGQAGSRPGGMGLPLARQVCDGVQIEAGPDGTTVVLRMRKF